MQFLDDDTKLFKTGNPKGAISADEFRPGMFLSWTEKKTKELNNSFMKYINSKQTKKNGC